jgi:hypothetical protein
VDSVDPGLDFADAIHRAIGLSEVLLAVIGRNWSDATDPLSNAEIPRFYLSHLS